MPTSRRSPMSSPPSDRSAPGRPSVRDLGRSPYQEVWAAMRRFTADRTPDTGDEIWLVEHPPVFTQGRNGRPEHLLAAGDIPVVHSDRGGQVTYHGPGQAVAYPLIDLQAEPDVLATL